MGHSVDWVVYSFSSTLLQPKTIASYLLFESFPDVSLGAGYIYCNLSLGKSGQTIVSKHVTFVSPEMWIDNFRILYWMVW